MRGVGIWTTAAMLVALAAGCGDSSGTGPDAGPPGDADTDCEPVAQTGCAIGFKCGFVLDDLEAGTGHVACVADGEHELGAYCEPPALVGETDSCRAGGYCYAGRCQAMCEVGGEPCPTGTCAPFLQLGFDVCLNTCDALAQDCPDTPGGNPQGCYLTGDGPLCAAVFGGDGTPPGGSCFFVNDCAQGAGCFDPGVCRAYCDLELCPPSGTLDWQPCPDYCESGELCIGILGEESIGACGAS